MKKQIKKGELFRKIFVESRQMRSLRLAKAMDLLSYADPMYSAYWANPLLALLNRAAPVKIDLGSGWIDCNSFGSVHAELGMISYRSRNHRSGCNALLGGIKLANIKGAELI